MRGVNEMRVFNGEVVCEGAKNRSGGLGHSYEG